MQTKEEVYANAGWKCHLVPSGDFGPHSVCLAVVARLNLAKLGCLPFRLSVVRRGVLLLIWLWSVVTLAINGRWAASPPDWQSGDSVGLRSLHANRFVRCRSSLEVEVYVGSLPKLSGEASLTTPNTHRG